MEYDVYNQDDEELGEEVEGDNGLYGDDDEEEGFDDTDSDTKEE